MFETVFEEWKKAYALNSTFRWSKLVATGEVKVWHYKGFLREIYHNVFYNSQTQAWVGMYISGEHRDFLRSWYQHARSEIGHDLLALNDLVFLGEDRDKVIRSKPNPSTTAFTSVPFFQAMLKNPVGYLGHLFHLEFMPSQHGHNYIEMLERAGIPREGMTFIEEHAHVDPSHNKLMMKYIEELVKTDDDLKSVISCAQDASYLYGRMIEDAFDAGERDFKE